MTSGVQRSATISAALAIGQNWPYRIMAAPSLPSPLGIIAQARFRAAPDSGAAAGSTYWTSPPRGDFPPWSHRSLRRGRSPGKEGAMFQRTLLLALACLGAAVAPARPAASTDRNQKAAAFVERRPPPPPAHRAPARMHVPTFDSGNSLERPSRP